MSASFQLLLCASISYLQQENQKRSHQGVSQKTRVSWVATSGDVSHLSGFYGNKLFHILSWLFHQEQQTIYLCLVGCWQAPRLETVWFLIHLVFQIFLFGRVEIMEFRKVYFSIHEILIFVQLFGNLHWWIILLLLFQFDWSLAVEK